MANVRSEEESRELRGKILNAATTLFMQKGFERTTLVDIAKLSGVQKAKILYEMNSKEEILGQLVAKFLDFVMEESNVVSSKYTDDAVLMFMASEVLQIYMAELNEDMRNLYLAAYSMPKTSEIVLRRRTDLIYEKFKDVFPAFALKDFYELEIASVGIMRGYMMVPCDMYFTMETKVERLITTMLRIYEIDSMIIDETKEFIRKIDFETVSEMVVKRVFEELGR